MYKNTKRKFALASKKTKKNPAKSLKKFGSIGFLADIAANCSKINSHETKSLKFSDT